MKVGVSGSELLGYCESVEENSKKVKSLRDQISAINADTTELTKITSTEFEVKPKDLKKVYKQYVDMKSEGQEDYFTLVALLEEELEKMSESEN